MTDETKKQPAAKLREGTLSAEIWENARDDSVQHNVTFARSWQDKDGNWRKSQSFSERDLLALQHLAGRAHDAIRERKIEVRKSERTSDRPKAGRTRERDRER